LKESNPKEYEGLKDEMKAVLKEMKEMEPKYYQKIMERRKVMIDKLKEKQISGEGSIEVSEKSKNGKE
jgi:hypothetical protein